MEVLELLHEANDVLVIPDELSPDVVMTFMESGLGYRWTVVSKEPYLVSHGAQDKGGIGEVALIERNILVWGEDVLVRRISHLLDVMRKTARRG
jgi:hypothetical protein